MTDDVQATGAAEPGSDGVLGWKEAPMTMQSSITAADLDACSREPIHIPGSIQPHGCLLVLGGPDHRITRASANLADLLGQPLDEVLGRPFAEAAPALARELEADLADEFLPASRYLRTIHLGQDGSGRAFDAVAHRSDGSIILELEECAPDDVASLDALYPMLRGFVGQLQNAGSVETLCALAAADIRRMTGFDRVLVYRFDEHWNGTVLAEDRNERLPSYLDLRFPASDIPAQARELYRRNRVRIIPDAGYRPVPIVSGPDAPQEALDLSQSVLRSVSPIHVEYMRNMGTASSMSVSIVDDGRLWGLISCHHAEPRRVSLRVRNACDFVTQIFALQVVARERAAQAERRMEFGSIVGRLLAHMAGEEHFLDGLMRHPQDLMRLAEAEGAAIVSGDRCWLCGNTPGEADVRRLFKWLSEHHREDVFATETLSLQFPDAIAYTDRASGLVSISISKVHSSYILWFRPEVIRTVKWGGNPTKPVESDDTGVRLSPRRSFETWKETVRYRAMPWDSSAVEAIRDLRAAIVGIVLRRAEELVLLNDELKRSNKELEAFSYSVSHDLRAPFRHIVGFSELLRSHESGRLSERGRHYVDTIIESAYTAGALVDNLLSFSQMGRSALKPRWINMNALVTEIQGRLSVDLKSRNILWHIHDLDPAHGDPFMIRLAVENLLSNAVKYTRPRDPAEIEVSSEKRNGEVILRVRDNGVGFDMTYVDKLFGVFQRLHHMGDFEGTGIGLANVRRVVERHGGRVWAEAVVDRGATFWMALPVPPDDS